MFENIYITKRNIKETFAKITGNETTNQNKTLKQRTEIKVQNNSTFSVTPISIYKKVGHCFSNNTKHRNNKISKF